MARWVVSEKGVPSERWELSIVDEDAKDADNLKRSYAWNGDTKIIVWSCGGSVDYVASESLAAKLRRVAQEHADELNAA